ncbi:MAG: outer membrane lipoprotein carrier protein LolA [marine benthic group bacterium]|nr:outer membrane lipoprotein carrier protein LolA [Candidatus Benthicola marisminoris]
MRQQPIDSTRHRASGPLQAGAVFVTVLFSLPTLTPTQEAPSPDVDVLLERAEEVYDGLESMTAAFEQTIEIPLLARKRDGAGTWYQKGAGRFKMDFSDPEGDVIVADGRHLWLYYPSTHPGQVIRSAIDANVTGAGMVDLQGRIFEEADTGYEATLQGSEDVKGNATWRIALIPTDESPYRSVRVWVDQESYLVRRFEIVEENETIRTVILDRLRPNEAIADSVFEFVPPEGADVFEG